MTAPVLQDGETALWSGKPEGGIAFRRNDIYMIPFSIFWVVIALGAFSNILPAKDNSTPTLMNFLFLLIGLYLTAGRFIVDIIRRRGTRYYLSNKRAIIEATFPLRRLKTKSVTAAMTVEYDVGRFSTVWFDGHPTMRRGATIPGMGFAPNCFAFERLESIDDLRRHLTAIINHKSQ